MTTPLLVVSGGVTAPLAARSCRPLGWVTSPLMAGALMAWPLMAGSLMAGAPAAGLDANELRPGKLSPLNAVTGAPRTTEMLI